MALNFPPRVAYASIAALLLGLGIVAARYHASLSRELSEAVMARHTALAQLAATTLSERLQRMVDLTVSLGTRVRFVELVAAGDWDAAGKILAAVPASFPNVDRLFLADPGGTLRFDVPELPAARGRNFAHRDWYQGVVRDARPYISPVYRREAAPQINVIAIAMPLRVRPGAPVAGILVLQLSLEAFFDWIAAVDLGTDAALHIVDTKRQAAYASRASVQGPARDLSSNPGVLRLQGGSAGAGLAADPVTGEERLYAFRSAAHGWAVVIEQPAAAAFAARDLQLRLVQLAYALVVLFVAAVGWLAMRIARERLAELKRTRVSLARHAERLRILREIDRAVVDERTPEEIAGAVIQPLRELLGVPRAIVNRFDLAAGEVEWVAAAGRRRVHVGPGVRYSIRLMGDLEALRRGEPQLIDVDSLPQGPEAQALLASDVHVYMAVPMIAGGELLGAVSFGGATKVFPAEQVSIVQEVATQLAIAIVQARLLERVRREAAQLEKHVVERTAELQVANRELQEANKELDSFSYSVSHDLRAPLRAVDGYARMLEEDYGERIDAEGRRLLSVVRQSSQRMGHLIDDLLAFSRLGRQAPSKTHVDMEKLAGEVAAELQDEAAARVVVSALPPAYADRALLKQVWQNLIGNALKYSSKRAQPRVEIGGRADSAELVYWVRDNGAGFDMRYAAKLFGVFQRLHRQDEFPGTGVGLAIVQRIVLRHGGRIWAEGAPDEGACFYFSLPRKN